MRSFRKARGGEKQTPKKLYIIDTEYPTALGYEFSISRAMENAAYLELLRRSNGYILLERIWAKAPGQRLILL